MDEKPETPPAETTPPETVKLRNVLPDSLPSATAEYMSWPSFIGSSNAILPVLPEPENKATDDKSQAVAQVAEPRPEAFQAYWLLQNGLNQGAIAEMLKTSQGNISKWIKKVNAWKAAGNAMPEIPRKPPMTSKPLSMDPEKLDLGPRGDHRPEHIKQKRAEMFGHD